MTARIRRPLSLKILAWSALNVALLAAAVALLFNAQFHFNLDWVFAAGGARDRLEAARHLIAEELNVSPPDEWSGILQRYSTAYRVPFSLFDDEGRYLIGAPAHLPAAVSTRLGNLRRGESTLIQTSIPIQYWLLTAGRLDNPQAGGTLPFVLVAQSPSLTAGGFIFDLRPWLWLMPGAVLCSILLWWPLVRGITRALAAVVQATRQIADGRFDVRVQVQRRDELGQLAEAINQMAIRLDDQTRGQKRFLGDVAHELCSPLARLRLALGVLEQRATETQAPLIQTAGEKAEQIATLVNELLLFSKASFGLAALQLQPVTVRALVDEALAREECSPEAITVDVPDRLMVTVEPDLLVRALGNLIRNALRYASPPLELRAARVGNRIEIHVADTGPGVPEAELSRIFEPFYRVDASRTRGTGGTGLGLTIVKSCVESCAGTVRARNRQPNGLEVILSLPEVKGPGPDGA